MNNNLVFKEGSAYGFCVSSPMRRQILRFLIVMKLIAVFVVLFSMQLSANVLAQHVTLKVKNGMLPHVLEEIQRQTGYDFSYNDQLLRKSKKVDLELQNVPLEKALDKIFSVQPFSYEVVDNIIIIKNKSKTGKAGGLKAHSVDHMLVEQQDMVRGRVVDESGKPLVGASVRVIDKDGKRTSQQTLTDKEGVFLINGIQLDDLIVVTLLGFKNEEIKHNGQLEVNIAMKATIEDLEGVVVVGYGEQNKRDVIAAISSVGEGQMDIAPSGSINTSLQGKVAGLQISNNSGEPGAGAKVVLRGATSISGDSQPLYIIDGTPIESSSYSSLSDGATFSPLNDINPSDIKSVEVLKDAAAASIYGSRAANGVIIITTKSGGHLRAPELNVAFNSGINDVIRRIGVLNGPEFRSAYVEAVYNQLGRLTDKIAVIDSLHPYYIESQNWQKIMYKPSLQHKTDVSLRGGSKDNSINYYVSASHRDLKPIVHNSFYKQQIGTGRMDFKINDKLRGATNFNFSNNSYQRVRTGLGTQSVVYQSLSTLPIYSPYDPISGAIMPLFEGQRRNPYAIAEYQENNISRLRYILRQELSYELLKGLAITSSVAYDYSDTKTDLFDPPVLNNSRTNTTVQSILNKDSRKMFITENLLRYRKNFKRGHNLNAILGQSYQKTSSDYFYFRGIGLVDGQLSSIGASSAIVGYDETLSENILFSLFSRVNYDYRGKYFVSAVMRRDGSSRFGRANRFGYFPSIASGYRFSDEEFFKRFSWLHEAKLRASYGVLGNQNIGNYAALGTISKTNTYLGEVSMIANNLSNPNLKWETTRQFNLGLDLVFLHEKLGLVIDLYRKNTSDLLFNVEVPKETGYGNMPVNFGAMTNKGLELTLTSNLTIHRNFGWRGTFTAAVNQNRITELPGGLDYRPNRISLARVGETAGVFYGLKSLGIYKSDEENVDNIRKGSIDGQIYKGGDVIWQDRNEDGIINDDDFQIIGDPNPRWFGGFHNEFTYKQFSFSFFVNYSAGNKVFNELKRSLDGNIYDTNFSTDQLRRWSYSGHDTDIPKLTKGDPMENYKESSRFVENGSFVRLQNLSVFYTLPNKKLAGIALRRVNVGVNVVNLLTFSKYTGYDPEVNASSNILENGVDRGAFPRSKSYNLSLNIQL